MIIPCKSCHSIFQVDSSLIKPNGSRVRCSKCQTIFKVYPPNLADRRKQKRIQIHNLISHFSFDKTGKLVSQGLGMALGISKGGILLETPSPIESGLILLMALDFENNLFGINGKLIHSKKLSAEMYQYGIEFVGNDAQVTKFITKLVKEYNYRKKDQLSSGITETHSQFPT
jgi:predicted Zn finger-like uncharacterized protein